MKTKNYPWQDRKYLEEICLCRSGIPKEKISRRSLTLLKDIQAVREKLDYYQFVGARQEIVYVFNSVIRRLRHGKDVG